MTGAIFIHRKRLIGAPKINEVNENGGMLPKLVMQSISFNTDMLVILTKYTYSLLQYLNNVTTARLVVLP